MEANDEHLKEKALLLLRRERELFELRMKHEKVTLWLKVTQMLPLLFAERNLRIDDAYAGLRKTLIDGLRLQRVSFLELGAETLQGLLPAGPPRPLPPEALSVLHAESAGFGNDPTDPAGAALAETLGLARFIWSRIDLPDRAPVVVAAGFDRAKAKFQGPFEASDAAHLRNATQHVEGLLGNTLLVHELQQERDRLQTTNETLQRRDRELQAATDELRSSNETLEQRVRDRTEELGHRNHNMRLVLDNVAQALLTVDVDGRLATERSAKADEWFGAFDGNPMFVDYIGRSDRDFSQMFGLGYETLNEQVMPTELCLAQLPKRLRAGERIFHCTYFLLPEAAAGSGLLIVVDDVTEQVRVAQEEAEQSELLALFQALTRDREGFLAFFQESSTLVEELASGALDEATRARYLHTLKGNAAMAGARVVAGLCHEAEDAVAMDGLSGGETAMKKLERRWAAVRRTVEMVVGDGARGIVEVPARALDQLCDEIGNGASLAHVAHQLNLFRLEAVERPLGRLAHYANALARRMGKGDLLTVLEAADIRVDPRHLGGLWSALVHVVRNAVDHGIEPRDERLARGKAADARLVLRAFRTPADLVIELEDDGRGIDWMTVRQRARSRGVPWQEQADLLRAILSDGFSTKSTVTMTSGRGVGMASVHHQVLRLGGTLSVKSEAERGTCWRITLPTSNAQGAAVESGDKRPHPTVQLEAIRTG